MIAVATRTACELLRFAPETPRAAEMLTALIGASGASGIELTSTNRYVGDSPLLLFWGPGAPERSAIMRQHVANGGRAIALDLAYWSRATKVRVSIDAAHPQAWVMKRELSMSRLLIDRPPVGHVWKPTGPIIVAGIGQKAKAQYGEQVDIWEAAMIEACLERWPDRAVIKRPKPRFTGPQIDGELKGASLLITWHSNVAVDAIRMGIPVVCKDGAAAAVCPSELPDVPAPLPIEVRDKFIANLSWFQWAPSEARAMWNFLRELLA